MLRLHADRMQFQSGSGCRLMVFSPVDDETARAIGASACPRGLAGPGPPRSHREERLRQMRRRQVQPGGGSAAEHALLECLAASGLASCA